MSDDFHRPTLTFPTHAYNATQVRLYGIAPDTMDSRFLYPGKTVEFKSQVGDLDVQISVTTESPQENEEIRKQLFELVPQLVRLKITEADIFSGIVHGTLLKLVVEKKGDKELQGAVANLLNVNEIKVAYVSKISIQMKQLGSVSISATITRKQAIASNKIITCGIILGYAYEGHTYDLPKPKIMIIPTLPESRIPDDDSGYDKKESEGYAVWLVDKLDECVEFELNQGFVEQLILDANLPGKRAPNMYAGRMMMGHRSGRLTE
jgi:hypothetical protein